MAGYFGDYKCNIPKRTADLFLREVNNWNVDFVIYSGRYIIVFYEYNRT